MADSTCGGRDGYVRLRQADERLVAAALEVPESDHRLPEKSLGGGTGSKYFQGQAGDGTRGT